MVMDSRQYWMDNVIRQVAEENMNPEVLSQDYRDPRFANRPMKPESKPYMGPWGGWLDAVIEKAASAAGWLDERSPQGAALTPTNPLYGGRAKAETAVRMMQPLRGRDLGATGVHEGDMYPGVPKAAGMVVGPAIKIAPDVIKAIKRLVRSSDEAVDVVKQVDELKSLGIARTPTPKIRRPVTDMGIHFGEMADESGYTKLITGGDPELTQLFYDTLDWKYMDQPYTAAEAAVLQRGQGRDVHAIYDDIRRFYLNDIQGLNPTKLTTQQSVNFNEAVNEKNAKEASNWLIDQAKLFEKYGESLDDLLG